MLTAPVAATRLSCSLICCVRSCGEASDAGADAGADAVAGAGAVGCGGVTNAGCASLAAAVFMMVLLLLPSGGGSTSRRLREELTAAVATLDVGKPRRSEVVSKCRFERRASLRTWEALSGEHVCSSNKVALR